MRSSTLLLAAFVGVVAQKQQGIPIYLTACSNVTAAWTQSANLTKLYYVVQGQDYCLDISDFNTNPGATVWAWPCGRGSKSNEDWAVSAASIKSMQTPPTCLAVPSPYLAGSLVTTANCSGSDPNQQLAFSAASARIVHVPSGQCVDSSSTPPAPPSYCEQAAHASWTFCNPDAALEDRAADIVSRLSQADKIAALGTATPALSSVGMPAYQWWSEATHGISGPGVHHDAALPGALNTALPITTSCSFNRSLWKATGNAIAREGRAFANAGLSGLTFWTPVINIVRDPRWGRNIETAGEDPFLSGEYAANFIQGFEHATEVEYPLQASTCCKHFVANELDAWNGSTRHTFNAIVTQQDLADSYLPSFQTCVEDGKASGIMCSYNEVNGVPSCANDWLLGTLLRDSWQFDGYVTSDCDADSDVYNSHHYTGTPEEAVADVLKAGTDVDCGGFVSANAASALAQGLLSEADIDTVLTRLFRLRLRLGQFDPPGPLSTIGPDQVCTPEHLELARDGVRQSVVLAKNTGGALPLSPAAFKAPVVIGPLATEAGIGCTTYYGSTPCANTSNNAPLTAIAQFIPSATAVLGVPSVSSTNESGIPAAVAAAAAADLVFLAIGSDLSLEKEAHDRTVTNFSAAQLALIAAVTDAAKGPVVALVFSGGAMDVTPLLAHPKIAGVIICGQPSINVVAVGDVVFGRTLDGRAVAPAGRMSQMTYPAAYVDQVSMFDFNMRPGPSAWPPGSNPGRTYRFYTGTPVLPFGFGLSYTTWAYAPFNPPAGTTLDLAPIRAAAEAQAATGVVGHIPAALRSAAVFYYVNVTNTGSVDSDEVVLGFLVPPGNGTDGVPLQELFGFERVHVPAGQTATVYLGAQGVRFTQAGADGVRRALPGDYTVRFGVRETAVHGGGFAEFSVRVA